MHKSFHPIVTILGAIAGVAAWFGYKAYNTPRQSIWKELGEKDPSGRELIEITGVKGADHGKTVKGYKLPSKITDNKFPLTVIVGPNQELVGKKINEKVTFTHMLNQDVVSHGTVDGVEGDYYVWYEVLKSSAVGA